MADEFKSTLDQLFSLVPKTGMTQRNNKTGAEYYGEVPSATSGTFSRPPATDVEGRKKWLEDVKKPFTENEKFYTLTGLKHKELLDNWIGGGIKTSCNGFVGKVAGALGIPGMGAFGVEKLVRDMGKRHCWLTPASGEKPGYGDIFETNSRTPGNDFENLHVGVSLSVEGDDWWTIEGGQGGPSLGYDRVARVKKKYNTEHLLGWVDMRMLMSGKAAMPEWLIGTWMIYAGDKNYIYTFNRKGMATQKPYRPATASGSDVPNLDTGEVQSVLGDTIKLRWNVEGGIETFTYDFNRSFPGLMERMNGKAADGSAMSGVRL